MDIQKVIQIIIPVLKKYKVRKAALFGSIVTGKMHKESDIDILVEMPQKATLFDMLGVKVELEEHLGRSVDVVEYEGIKPILKPSILANQLFIYKQT